MELRHFLNKTFSTRGAQMNFKSIPCVYKLSTLQECLAPGIPYTVINISFTLLSNTNKSAMFSAPGYFFLHAYHS